MEHKENSRPSTSAKVTCAWCNRESLNPIKIDDEAVCQRCLVFIKRKKCRICGGPLGEHHIRGICIGCIQLNHVEETREEEERSNGLSNEGVSEIIEEREFTEEDYNSFITFGGGIFKPKAKKEGSKEWALNRFQSDKIWTSENIDQYITDIDKLAQRHKDKINNQNIHIIRITDIIEFIGAKVVDKENQVILIET